MKKFLIIFLVLLSYNIQAQQLIEMTFTSTEQHGREFFSPAAKVVITYSAAILLNATGDALYDEGITKGGNYKIWGKSLRTMGTLTLLASPLWSDYDKDKWLTYLLTYTCLRISLFDPTYNLTRGLPFNYIGSTSLWDKGLNKVGANNWFTFARGISLVAGISIPINNLNGTQNKRYHKNKTFNRL